MAEEQDGSLTALDVASHMKVSITLAQEYLKVGDQRGLLLLPSFRAKACMRCALPVSLC